MTESEEESDISDELPELIISELEQSSDGQLHAIIDYAQKLLQERNVPTTAIEAREGEEIVRKDDHGAYTIVIVKQPDATGANRGPFAYRVKYEPDIDDGEGRFRWQYLGQVED